jgi:hypothetical protein
MKLTIMIDVSEDAQKNLAVQWIKNNTGKIIAVFGNDGCGCCIDTYHLDCQDDIAPLPIEISCQDDWTDNGKNRCPQLTIDEVISDIVRHLPGYKGEG